MWALNCAQMCMGINLGVLYASHGKRENMPHGFTRSLGMVAKSRRSSPRPLGHLAPCQEKQTGSHGGGSSASAPGSTRMAWRQHGQGASLKPSPQK